MESKNIIEIDLVCHFHTFANLNFLHVCLDLPNMIPHGYKISTDNLNLDNIEVFFYHMKLKISIIQKVKKIIFILSN